MQTKSRLFDDIAKLGSGVVSLVLGVKDELKKRTRLRAEHIARELDLVTRDEFNVTRDVAQAAREHSLDLEKRVAKLEKPKSKTTPRTQTKKTK
jgi:hypothetical protein